MNILTAVLDVFTAIGNWILDVIPDMTALFYDTTNGLTFLGVLAVAGLAMSVIFLVIGIIQNFLHFRG